MRIAKNCLVALVLLYILIGACLFIFQRDFVYFPTEEIQHDYQTERLLVNEETINVIVVNGGMSNAILYFGGQGETIADRASDFEKTFDNHTIYLVNYRGYGGSTGDPTEKNLYADAGAVYDLVSKRHSSLSVIGRSLGTGIATYLASIKAVNKLVLVTPYDSIEHIAQDSYPIYPMSILLKDKYNSFDRVSQIHAPTLIILAETDLTIPVNYSNRLINKFPASKVDVFTVKGTGHSNIVTATTYLSLLGQFM